MRFSATRLRKKKIKKLSLYFVLCSLIRIFAPSFKKSNTVAMGKLMLFLYFILSVFPADATENRRHIHVVRRGSKKSHRGDTVAKIWIEQNGEKKIEVAWSELNADEESEILKAIDKHWEELNKLIDDVFAGKKIQIKRIK